MITTEAIFVLSNATVSLSEHNELRMKCAVSYCSRYATIGLVEHTCHNITVVDFISWFNDPQNGKMAFGGGGGGGGGCVSITFVRQLHFSSRFKGVFMMRQRFIRLAGDHVIKDIQQ